MYAEISSAISSFKTVLEIAKAATSLSNYNELVSAVSDVNSKLMDVTAVALASQEKQHMLMAEIKQLKDELAEINSWENESKNYVLQSVGVEKKHFAQVYKPLNSTNKANHWACVKCFADKKIYILNAKDRIMYKCCNCGETIAPIIRGGTLAPIESAYS